MKLFIDKDKLPEIASLVRWQRILQCSYMGIWKAAKNGRLKTIRRGRRIVATKEQIVEWQGL
jgi:hypothetical protein